MPGSTRILISGNERTGIIMGSGGSVHPHASSKLAEIDHRDRFQPEAHRPVCRCRRPCRPTASATLATWFKIHGVELLDLLGLRRRLNALRRQCRMR